MTAEHLQAEVTATARHQLAYNGNGWAVSDKEAIIATRRAVLETPGLLGQYFPELQKAELPTVLLQLSQLGDDINHEIGTALQKCLSKFVKPGDYIQIVRNLQNKAND